MTVRIAYAYPRSTFTSRLGDLLGTMLATLRLWVRRRHDRHALSQLDDHMLRDIGFDRTQANEMASRPFWRA